MAAGVGALSLKLPLIDKAAALLPLLEHHPKDEEQDPSGIGKGIPLTEYIEQASAAIGESAKK